MTGVAASTVMVSVRLPTWSRKSALLRLFTTTWTLRLVVLKPSIVTVTVYTQTGSSARRYPPAASLTTERLRPVAPQIALTLAPVREPPVESATVPVMSPVILWAYAAGATPTASAATATARSSLTCRNFMDLSPSLGRDRGI